MFLSKITALELVHLPRSNKYLAVGTISADVFVHSQTFSAAWSNMTYRGQAISSNAFRQISELLELSAEVIKACVRPERLINQKTIYEFKPGTQVQFCEISKLLEAIEQNMIFAEPVRQEQRHAQTDLIFAAGPDRLFLEEVRGYLLGRLSRPISIEQSKKPNIEELAKELTSQCQAKASYDKAAQENQQRSAEAQARIDTLLELLRSAV